MVGVSPAGGLPLTVSTAISTDCVATETYFGRSDDDEAAAGNGISSWNVAVAFAGPLGALGADGAAGEFAFPPPEQAASSIGKARLLARDHGAIFTWTSRER
jgi:hypothetical protein